MSNNEVSISDLKKDIETLMAKVKDPQTSKEEKLATFELLNSIVEFKTEFIKELKKEI